MAFPDIVIGSSFDGKGFKQALTATEKLEKNVKSLAKGFLGVFAAQKVLAFGKASVKAFAEDDAAAKSLGQTLKNLGLAYGANVGTVNGFIGRLEMQTGVLDDELRPALDRILRATGDVTKSQELLSLALDIAAGTGKSVTQVTQSLQKAYLGQTQALGRLGVGLSKAELESSNFEEIQARLADLFAGQAKRASDSYQGSLNKLQVAANNAKETIGKGLVDALGTLSNSQNVDGTVSAIDRIAKAISNATVDFAKFIKVSQELLGTGFFLDEAEKAALRATKMGTRFTTPMSISSQDTQRADKAAADAAKKAAAAKIKADKAAAAAKIKADALAASNAAKLAKAQSIFDIDKIQIEAALKGKISDDEKLRLELQRAILNEDFDLADKLQKKLEASQRATAALQGQITGIKPPVDPFAETLKSLESIALLLGQISGYTFVDPGKKGGGILALEPDDLKPLIPESKPPTSTVITEDKIPVIIEPSPAPSTNNAFAGLGGGTFGFSLPEYVKEAIPQIAAPVTVNVTVTGSVIAQQDLVQVVNDAVVEANTQGRPVKRPGGVRVDEG